MTRALFRTLSIALAVGACSSGPLTVCTDELRVSLTVSVVDAVTGESAATGSTINLRGAAFQDSVVLTKDSPYVQWEDSARAGVYDIMVRKLGYHDWSQSGVRIEGGRCHVPSPTRVIALLQAQ